MLVRVKIRLSLLFRMNLHFVSLHSIKQNSSTVGGNQRLSVLVPRNATARISAFQMDMFRDSPACVSITTLLVPPMDIMIMCLSLQAKWWKQQQQPRKLATRRLPHFISQILLIRILKRKMFSPAHTSWMRKAILQHRLSLSMSPLLIQQNRI